MNELTYTATCLFGLEALLGEEIDSLGYRRTETMDGRITFKGDGNAAARANVKLRYAERLYLNLGEFEAPTFDALFEGTRALPWEDVIGRDGAFPVSGHSIKSRLTSIPDCQKIIKKSVCTRLGEHYGLSRLPETGTAYKLEFFIFKDRASLMIDLSGDPLHKRGYRPERVTAPLRETLAAAMVKLSRPRENVITWDPFCGSGTVAIEAAMLMKNIAPGVNRRFAAEKFPFFPEKSWENAREEAKSAERESDFRAYASDIDPECVRIAEESARRAGVEDTVKIFRADARQISGEGLRGTIVTNPPYGERLMTKAETERLYREIGEHFRTLPNWQFYILTSWENFAEYFGRRPDKVRRLYNGMIPCAFYQFFKNDSVRK